MEKKNSGMALPSSLKDASGSAVSRLLCQDKYKFIVPIQLLAKRDLSAVSDTDEQRMKRNLAIWFFLKSYTDYNSFLSKSFFVPFNFEKARFKIDFLGFLTASASFLASSSILRLWKQLMSSVSRRLEKKLAQKLSVIQIIYYNESWEEQVELEEPKRFRPIH